MARYRAWLERLREISRSMRRSEEILVPGTARPARGSPPRPGVMRSTDSVDGSFPSTPVLGRRARLGSVRSEIMDLEGLDFSSCGSLFFEVSFFPESCDGRRSCPGFSGAWAGIVAADPTRQETRTRIERDDFMAILYDSRSWNPGGCPYRISSRIIPPRGRFCQRGKGLARANEVTSPELS